MAEQEPPGGSKPNNEGQGTGGQPQEPHFTPDVDRGARGLPGPQRLRPEPPVQPEPKQSPEPVPPPLHPFLPPRSEDVEPPAPSPIIQAPPPSSKSYSVGQTKGGYPPPSINPSWPQELQDEIRRERGEPPPQPTPPDEKPDK